MPSLRRPRGCGSACRWFLSMPSPHSWRTDNPAVAVSKVLQRRRKARWSTTRLCPTGELPAFIQALGASTADTVTRLGLEFLVLSVARTGEVRFMEWGEVDTEAATWTVPASRMKARGEHRVPLSRWAVAILEEARSLGTGSGLVFPSQKGEAPQRHGLHHGPPTARRGQCRPARLSVDLQGLDAGTDRPSHGPWWRRRWRTPWDPPPSQPTPALICSTGAGSSWRPGLRTARANTACPRRGQLLQWPRYCREHLQLRRSSPWVSGCRQHSGQPVAWRTERSKTAVDAASATATPAPDPTLTAL